MSESVLLYDVLVLTLPGWYGITQRQKFLVDVQNVAQRMQN